MFLSKKPKYREEWAFEYRDHVFAMNKINWEIEWFTFLLNLDLQKFH